MSGKRHRDFIRPRDPAGTRRGDRLARLAAAQHGVVSRAQLYAIGCSRYAVERDIKAGRLHRVFRGVYAVGYPCRTERGRLMAAALACGAGAVISHRSAAALFGLLDRGPRVVDAISPHQGGRRIQGIRVHRIALPPRPETGKFDGIPCVSPSRALAEIAGEVGTRTLRSAFERAAAKRLLDVAAVEAAARASRGAGAARSLCAEWRDAAPIAAAQRLKSPLEAKVLPILVRSGTPPSHANAPIRLLDGTMIEVDFLWQRERHVVEADSRDFHATDVAFERDRRRDRELLRAGYSTLRVTRLEAENEPEAVAAAIAARLAEARD